MIMPNGYVVGRENIAPREKSLEDEKPSSECGSLEPLSA